MSVLIAALFAACCGALFCAVAADSNYPRFTGHAALFGAGVCAALVIYLTGA